MSRLEFKPQDRQSIDFAEEERQKNKNLFNPTYELGFYDISNGKPTSSNSYKRTTIKMPIKPNANYVFSTTQPNPAQIIVFYDQSLQFVSYVGMSDYSLYKFSTPANAYYFAYYTQKDVNADIQIEEGNSATSWQKYTNSEKVETIYDALSTDSKLNLGYYGGIARNGNVRKDFSRYKRLIITCKWGDNAKIQSLVDLTCPHIDGSIQICLSSTSNSYSDTDLYWIIASINSDKNVLNFENGGFDTFSERKYIGSTTSLEAKIMKIEGVF